MIIVLSIGYFIILVATGLRIIYDTEDTGKALAFLLVITFVPIIGILIYLLFGINHRKRKIFENKCINNKSFFKKLNPDSENKAAKIIEDQPIEFVHGKKMMELLINEIGSPVSDDNQVKILINGESKFPELIIDLENARDHIHIEYYIFEDDNIGRTIEEILIKKALEGVEVRVIYDDFGSRSIRKKMIPRLKEAGVTTNPFYEIKYMLFANRINYRNHRKITVIDGHTAYVGGINIGDEYINRKSNKKKKFWRDSHLKLSGSSVKYLQYLFITDWNFCSDEDDIEPNKKYFPPIENRFNGNKIVQISASGPDSDAPTIHHSMLQAVNGAKRELFITTPYFIPGESLMDALCIAAQSNVNVKLLIPKTSDSKIVDNASAFYFNRLLRSGVEIYQYTKGFIHSKSMIIDNTISILGTANMDIRSFDLNFEVNAILYDGELTKQMKDQFYEDLKNADQINKNEWEKRSIFTQLLESIARLFSPIL
jgi:cardiolipin synthase